MKARWTALATLGCQFCGRTTASSDDATDLAVRASPDAPDGYAPATVDCPSTRPAVRDAGSVAPSESDWLNDRRNVTADALADFFQHASIPDFDAPGYINTYSENATALPNVAIAVSGGGYRALMNGAGALAAFDNRTPLATEEGHLGGLLQSSTYLAGLSGGGWLVGSVYLNNGSTVPALRASSEVSDDSSVWDFEQSILEGPDEDGIGVLDTAEYYNELADAVDNKRDAGYQVSITDYWGRALSYQLINDTQGGVGYTWSSISQGDLFSNAEMPMPILIADGRNPGEKLITGNATNFEFNPFEFGTFDPTVFGFVPIEFLGSPFVAGSLPSDESCVRGFDNAGFIMGTSSSLFNQFALNLDTVDIPDFIKDVLSSILDEIGEDNNDIAQYQPNPFYHYSNDSSPFADYDALNLVDGGEDLQNIPFHPLVQPEREVDVIFAVDSSADTDANWPNGTALVATYERTQFDIANGTAFPAIPDVNTFVNLGLNNRPTFFGCNSSNTTTSSDQRPAPLIVYLPNVPYITNSNVSTFTMAYDDEQRNAIIQNGADVVTQGNATLDDTWPACVACAVLSRSFERTGTEVPAACQTCFDDYCWDGTLNTTTPEPYEPTMALDEVEIDAKENAAAATVSVTNAVMVAVMVAAVGSLLSS